MLIVYWLKFHDKIIYYNLIGREQLTTNDTTVILLFDWSKAHHNLATHEATDSPCELANKLPKGTSAILFILDYSASLDSRPARRWTHGKAQRTLRKKKQLEKKW